MGVKKGNEMVKELAEGTIAEPERKVQLTKGQVLTSARFADRRDLVNALLDDSTMYTIEQVENRINDYLKGTVK